MEDTSNISSEKEKKGFSMRLKRHFTRNIIFYIIILAGFAYVGFLTYDFGRRAENLRIELDAEKETVYVETQKIIDKNNEEALKMGLTTFVWAIRGEMLSEDYEQVNQYILQLIKEDRISDIVIANKEGVIINASNKKMEKTTFEDTFDKQYLVAENTDVVKQTDGTLHLIAPIMSFNSKIGTVVMVYHPETLKVEKLEEEL